MHENSATEGRKYLPAGSTFVEERSSSHMIMSAARARPWPLRS
jgi:hypothetical protein